MPRDVRSRKSFENVTESSTIAAPTLTAPLSSLALEHKCWANPRTILDDAKLGELGESIKEYGILAPVHVARVMENGSIIHLVLDGQRRVLASSRVLKKTHEVPIVYAWPDVIEELTWEISDQLLTIALNIGNRREALSSYELVETAERLKGRGKNNADIARALNRSDTWVSRMLKARLSATPKLLATWRRGEVSDEQFKALATEKDEAKQEGATAEVAAARQSGDKGGARMTAREVQAASKPVKEPKAEKSTPAKPVAPSTTNGVKVPPAVTGPQESLPGVAPVKKKLLPVFVVEEMLDLRSKRPPVHDYVRGVFDALEYVLGDKQLAQFAKPWHQYIARHNGETKPAKVSKPARAKKIAKAAKKRAAKAKK
jgi:ParB/RepB/Spo0J family partition protein